MTALVNLDHEERVGQLEAKLREAHDLLYRAQFALDGSPRIFQDVIADEIRAFLEATP